MYKLFLALRYLRTRKIAFISVIGIALGVTALLVITSVMGGFARDLRARIRSTTSHITITATRSSKLRFMDDWETLAAAIRKDPDVLAVAPQIEWPLMIDKGPKGASLIGIVPELESQVSSFGSMILDGHPPDFSNRTGEDIPEGMIPALIGSGVLGAHRNKDLIFLCDGPGSAAAAADCLPVINPKDKFEIITPDDEYGDKLSSAAGEKESGAGAAWARKQKDAEFENWRDILFRALKLASYDATKEDRRAYIIVFTSRIVPREALGEAWKSLEPPARSQLQLTGLGEALREPGSEESRDGRIESIVPGPNNRELLVDILGHRSVGLSLTITSISPKDVQGGNIRGEITPSKGRLAIVGVFNCGNNEVDSQVIFAPLAHVQKLLNEPNRVNRLRVKIRDYDKTEEVCARLKKNIPRHFDTITWQEEKAILLQAVAVERTVMAIVLFFIILVAAFSILAVLTMLVTEKTRDIGILRAQGATVLGIMSIFLTEGIIIGIIGCASGFGLAAGILANLNPLADKIYEKTGWYPFPKDIYLLDQIPCAIHPPTWVAVIVATMGVCVLASVFPAWKAARLNPIEALRYE